MKKVSILGMTLLSAIAFATVIFINSCSTDACKDVTCLNGGTCVDGTCDCAAGYEGTDCSSKTADKYAGTWSATDACSSGNYPYTATITASSTDVTKIIISNFGGFGSTVSVNATVNGNSMTIASQTFGAVTISGSGTLAGDALTLNVNYTANDGVTNDACIGNWVKQ